MSFGLALGLVVAIIVYLRSPFPPDPVPRTAAPASQPRATPPAAQPQPPKPDAQQAGNRFQFYEILPQAEVEVPAAGDRTSRSDRPRPAAAPGSFLLQAGSFSAAADADRLQANLALLGFESHVQRVKIEDAVFNRVRIGPIADITAAQQAQRKLRDAGIDALLMRVPQ